MPVTRVIMAALTVLGLCLLPGPPSARASEDARALVEMPAMMQQHMLANMRDHLVAIEEILDALANGNANAAAEISETRLGMSSLSLHGAEHMAQVMPKEMAAIGTQMHRAASRFAIIAQDADVTAGVEAQRSVYQALQAITQNCNACHQNYRIR